MDETTFTLAELAIRVAEVLRGYAAAPNGQVRAVPDERAIRYYTSLGLLDRPLALRGRTALYGARHLAQVVAIKRLQGVGRTLAEIQALLPTLTDAALSRASGIKVPRRAATSSSHREFWKEAPASEREPSAGHASRHADRAESSEVSSAPSFASRLELELTTAVTLSISALREATAADAEALLIAAAPLLAELRRRHLTPPL